MQKLAMRTTCVSFVILLLFLPDKNNAQVISKGCFSVNGVGSRRYFSLVQTSDGNYVIGGLEFGFSGAGLDQNFWVFKIDGNGALLWSSSIGGTAQDCCYRLIETSDHNILAVGSTGSSGHQNMLVVKYSADGNIIWSKNIDHPADISGDNAYAQGVAETTDGYVITGTVSVATAPGTHDAYLIKLDPDGNKQWSTRLATDSYGYEYPQDVLVAKEGGYTISGWGNSGFITHVNDVGTVQWSQAANISTAFDLVQMDDTNYLLSGYRFYTGQPNGNAFVTKIDTAGSQIWSKTYGGNGIETFYGLYLTNDGGFIAAGTADTNAAITPGSQKGFAVKCNSAGEIEWSKKINSSPTLEDVIQTSDGGYFFLGYNILIKTDADGNACDDCGMEDFGTEEVAGELTGFPMSNIIPVDGVLDSVYTEYTGGTFFELCTETADAIRDIEMNPIQIYPNPVSEVLHLVIPENELLYQPVLIMNMQGIILMEFSPAAEINIKGLPSGIYCIEINSRVGTFIKQ